ncbi:MAG: hypothetical protein JJE13_04295 [Thermoleophilia bacterium]|nr:hypothetical protein [Thermoleophilia bacterium]
MDADDEATQDESRLIPLAEGSVRAAGSLSSTGIRVFVDWNNGELSGHDSGVLEFERAIQNQLVVRMPHTHPSSCYASVESKADFFGTASSLLVDCTFSEPVPLYNVRGDVRTLGPQSDPDLLDLGSLHE